MTYLTPLKARLASRGIVGKIDGTGHCIVTSWGDERGSKDKPKLIRFVEPSTHLKQWPPKFPDLTNHYCLQRQPLGMPVGEVY